MAKIEWGEGAVSDLERLDRIVIQGVGHRREIYKLP